MYDRPRIRESEATYPCLRQLLRSKGKLNINALLRFPAQRCPKGAPRFRMNLDQGTRQLTTRSRR
jgi:hypothetical protein